jgi:hypothetical protein
LASPILGQEGCHASKPVTSTHSIPKCYGLEHDAPKLTDFGDNIMLQIIDFDHVYDFGLIQSKIIVI